MRKSTHLWIPFKVVIFLWCVIFTLFRCQERRHEAAPDGEGHSFATDTMQFNRLFGQAYELSVANEFDSATILFEAALEGYEDLILQTKDSAAKSRYLEGMAVAADRGWALTGKVDTALFMLDTALTLAKAWFGPVHPTLAFIHKRTADVKWITKRWEEVFYHLDTAIQTYTQCGDAYLDEQIEAYHKMTGLPASVMDIPVKSTADILLEDVVPLLEKDSSLVKKWGPLVFNELGRVRFTQNDKAAARQYFQKALSIMDKKEQPDPQKANSYSRLGQIYLMEGKIEISLDHYHDAIAEILKHYPENDYRVTNLYDRMAVAYLALGNEKKGLEWLHHSFSLKPPIEELRKYPGLDNNFLTFGQFYSSLGDYEKALEYYKRALNENLHYYKKPTPVASFILAKLGFTYGQLGLYDLSEEYLDRAYRQIREREQRYEYDHTTLVNIFTTRGYIAYEKKEFQQSKDNFNEAFKLRSTHQSGNAFTVIPGDALHYLNLAKAEAGLNNPTAAKQYFEKSLNITREEYGENHPRLSHIYPSYISFLGKTRQYKEAFKGLDKLLKICGLQDSLSSDYHFKNAYGYEVEKHRLMYGLASGVNLLYNFYLDHPDDTKSLEQALEYGQIHRTVQSSLFREVSRESSLDYWQSLQVNFTEVALNVCHKLYALKQKDQYLNEAFVFMEKGKARALRANLNKQYALKFAGVPEAIVDSLQNLEALMAFYEEKILDAKAAPQNHQVSDLEEKLYHLKNTHDKILEDIASNYPDYYRLKYDRSLPSIRDIQNELTSDHTAVIEYFWGDSSLFMLAVGKDTAILHRQAIDSVFSQNLQQFIELNRGAPAAAEKESDLRTKRARLGRLGHALYIDLLNPVLSSMEDIDQLILIPDGELGYLPFDLLLNTPVPADQINSCRSWPFLLKAYTLQYEHAAQFLLPGRQESENRRGKLLAFAPEFERADEKEMVSAKDSLNLMASALKTRQSLSPLPYNQPEALKIQQETGGQVLLGEAATESAFKQKANQYGILHFATHARVGDEHPNYSHLVFAKGKDTLEDQYLHAYELYNMRLHVDLAVLSACETGIGKVQRGEGIMSLSRAFKYAGCPNIVTSLWKAEDQSTQEIMVDFYKKLKEGKGKAEALRQAKLNFLARADQSRTHPFFWGAFILIGDDAPVKFSNTQWMWWIGAVVVILIVGVIIQRVRRNNDTMCR